MQFRRLSALIGLVFCLAIIISLPATAQRKSKDKNSDTNTGKSTAKLPRKTTRQALKEAPTTPSVTNCPVKTPIISGQTINGTLASGDCTLPQDGSFFDEYTFSGTAGQRVSILMTSATFDAYLFLLMPSETVVDFDSSVQDDDGGGGTNARIPFGSGFFTLPETGTYSIIANVFSNPPPGNPATGGAYSVTFNFGPGTCPMAATPISNGQTLNGSLDVNDCSLGEDNSRFDLYTFSATAGQQVAITMTAAAPVDAFLVLFAPDGTDIAQNDDGGGGTNARLPPVSGFGALPATGTYTILANSAGR